MRGVNNKAVWPIAIFLLSLAATSATATSAAERVRPSNVAFPASEWTTVGPGEMDTDSVMVSMIQYLLRAHGYQVAVDGEYGPATQRQVRAFQRHRSLRVTGSVDGHTWERLIVSLRQGSHGDAVRAAQASLQQTGDLRLPIDGLFGTRTERAVRALQKADGLCPDGTIGPVTWLHLTDPVPD